MYSKENVMNIWLFTEYFPIHTQMSNLIINIGVVLNFYVDVRALYNLLVYGRDRL